MQEQNTNIQTETNSSDANASHENKNYKKIAIIACISTLVLWALSFFLLFFLSFFLNKGVMARAIAPPIMPPITPYAAIFILLLLVRRGSEVVCRYRHQERLWYGQAIRERSYGFATDVIAHRAR